MDLNFVIQAKNSYACEYRFRSRLDNPEYSYSFAEGKGGDRWIRRVRREEREICPQHVSALKRSGLAPRHPSLLTTSLPTSQYSSQLYTEACAQLRQYTRRIASRHPRLLTYKHTHSVPRNDLILLTASLHPLRYFPFDARRLASLHLIA